MNVASASVLICTYNRASLLRDTLSTLSAMDPPEGCAAEIVVVDNNSTDETPRAIAEAAGRSRIPIVAIREARQGKSFALNRGLAACASDVIALTDDDVWVSRDWLARIVADFRSHDVTFVCGKVWPHWAQQPPPELLVPLAQRIWGPLALVDYGDTPIIYVPDRIDQRLPIGANLAFTREALVAIGGWRPDLGKIDNTLISGEDHEIFMRLRQFGRYSGLYDPELTVRHLVPPERLTRRYFRRWFFWNGKTQALMLDDLFVGMDMATVPHVLGIPRFLYREALEQLGRWLGRVGRRDGLELLVEELHLLQFAGLFTEVWRRRIRQARIPRGRTRWA